MGVDEGKFGNKCPKVQCIIMIAIPNADVHKLWHLQNIQKHALLPCKQGTCVSPSAH